MAGGVTLKQNQVKKKKIPNEANYIITKLGKEEKIPYKANIIKNQAKKKVIQ